MAVIHLDTGFERWPEVRALIADGVSPVEAALVAVRLYRELADLIPTFRVVGFVPASMLAQVATEAGTTVNRLTATAAPFLQPTDGGFLCQRFAESQGHLDPAYRPMHQKGAAVSRHRRDLSRYATKVVAQSLFIPADWMATDGKAWDAAHARQVMLVIRALDNALGLPARPATESGYSQPLLADASALVQKEGWEAISLVAESLIGMQHPLIPKSTERLIERWAEVKEIPELKNAILRKAA